MASRQYCRTNLDHPISLASPRMGLDKQNPVQRTINVQIPVFKTESVVSSLQLIQKTRSSSVGSDQSMASLAWTYR